jgi:hypothetical protein
MLARLLLPCLSFALLTAPAHAKSNEARDSSQETPSFSSYRETTIDPTWVTPIGVAGHHRTFGVSFPFLKTNTNSCWLRYKDPMPPLSFVHTQRALSSE